MKARLKVLPDKLRGGAWPSPVRAVRCPVKSGNDRDPRPLLPPASAPGTLGGLPPIRRRKERATAGQYAPNPPGHTRAAMAGTMGSDPERGRQSLNPAVVGIEGCNPPS
jgi:hypothetical protein